MAPVVRRCYYVKMHGNIIWLSAWSHEPWHGAADADLCAEHQEMCKILMATEFRDMWHV